MTLFIVLGYNKGNNMKYVRGVPQKCQGKRLKEFHKQLDGY